MADVPDVTIAVVSSLDGDAPAKITVATDNIMDRDVVEIGIGGLDGELTHYIFAPSDARVIAEALIAIAELVDRG